jgi:SAM-dependent methyltransferase
LKIAHAHRQAVLILGLGLLLISCQRSGSADEEEPLEKLLRKARIVSSQSISLRNGTESFLEYTVKQVDSQQIPRQRILDTGEIETFAHGRGVTVTYSRKQRMVRQDLALGKTYSFIRDDQGEVLLTEGWLGLEHPQDLAPFVATPLPVAEKMLEMAGVDEGDLVYDLGCGDGRIVILAAQKFGARGVGIDYNPKRIQESLAGAKAAGVESRVEFRLADVMKADFSDATVVTVYLLTRSNEKLRPLLEDQLKPGSLVVAHNYRVPGWENKEIDQQTLELEPGDTHILFLYRR